MSFRIITDNLSPTEILDKPPLGWEKAFEESRKEIILSEKNVKKYDNHAPPLTSIFKMHQRMAPENIKVAIFFDEPDGSEYGFPQMNGYGISGSKKELKSPLVKKIHERLFDTVEGYVPPEHNSLEKWLTQGVFLSSIYLTTGLREKHKPLWNGFTVNVMKHISRVNPRCIFFLWGNEASDYHKYVMKHPVFKTSSLYSTQVGKDDCFLNMDHFNSANKILEAQSRKKIDWSL